MKPSTTEWNAVALAKLTNVLGEVPGQRLMVETLAALDLPRLHSSSELRHFAQLLVAKGGFAAAIGGMLNLHATMYGGTSVTDFLPDAAE
ncbi:MAG: hypothetical protein NVSMB1_26020 [Polyangiales bacterium]